MTPIHSIPIQPIPLNQIDVTDTSFRITTRDQTEHLTRSIEQFGLLSPPVVVPKSTSIHAKCIVCGVQRVVSCIQLGWSQIPVRILNRDTSKLDCIRLSVMDNASQRKLNWVEMARAVFLLSEFFPDVQRLATEAETLGLPVGPSLIPKLMPINDMPPEVLESIAAGVIPVAMVEELVRIGSEASQILARLFGHLKPGLNVQREIIRNVEEIAKRDHTSIPEILRLWEQEDTSKHPWEDRNQITRRLRSWLKHRRYPHLSAAEEKYARLIQQIKPGHGIHLEAPESFEGNTYTIRFQFQNRQQLDDRLEALSQLTANPGMDQLFQFKKRLLE